MSQLETLRWQFRLTWSLAAEYHLPRLSDEACLWKPHETSWSVWRDEGGRWRHDWADEEPAQPPTVTVGWLTWQVVWWWSGLLAAVRNEPPPTHDAVEWPGSAEAVRERLHQLARDWSAVLDSLSETDLARPLAYPWPEPQQLALSIAWANSELMKNVAEVGILLHQFQARGPSAG